MHFRVVNPFYRCNMHPISDIGCGFEKGLSISFVVVFGVRLIDMSMKPGPLVLGALAPLCLSSGAMLRNPHLCQDQGLA